ncbi:MAG TPA: ABC transporter substrate-binding protein [Sphingobium sp.]
MSDGTAPGRRTGLIAAVAVIVVAILAVLAFWRAGSGRDGAQTLTVGDQRGGVQSLLQAAGELDDVPYHIEWALFPAASPLLEALGSGAVDIGSIGGSPFAFAYAGGAKIKAVFAARSPTGRGSAASAIVVLAKSPLRSVADLRGKRIATVRGSAGQDLALQLLDHHGLKASDVKWVYLNNGEAKAALGTGDVDAWSTWGSYVGLALLKDGDRALGDARELPAQAGFYAASDKAIATKRAQLTDFVARIARARTWALTHRDSYAAILAKETGIPVDVARFTVEGQMLAATLLDDTVANEQRAIFERYVKAGIIPKVPSIDGAFDPSFTPKS